MHLANVHADRSGLSVAHDHGTPRGAVPSAIAHPAKTVGPVVKVVSLAAVGEDLSGHGEFGERTAAAGFRGVRAAGAKEVAVEDARVAGLAEEDEGVREGLEPVGDGGLEGLVGLRVVVHNQSLPRISL